MGGCFISQDSLFLHSPISIIFLLLFLCSSLHISPNLHLPLFSQYVQFSFFSFNGLTGSSFFCSLFIICIGISSGISISPGDVFSDSFVFLSFIFAVSSFFVFSFTFSFTFSFSLFSLAPLNPLKCAFLSNLFMYSNLNC